MGTLTEDMKRIVREQRCGFIATVCPDGTPNLSPKGTTTAWDDDHLVFAEIASSQTIANLRLNPVTEINVVDPMIRKGYRFKGTATILTEGPVFEQILASYTQRGVATPIRCLVLVKVERAAPLLSPVYAHGLREPAVRNRWLRYWDSLHREKMSEPTGE
jgi:predicted pyridoxine 5'-phosphate oxidase superfamily flavin-nucleotide-binding protein